MLNLDISIFKSFPLPREGWMVQVRFEAFNLLNVQNWDVPSGTMISNANAGQITSLASGTTPRQMQFGLRLQF